MRKRNWWGMGLAGLGAGAVSGLFGAGGGMVLISLLRLCAGLKEDALFGSSLCIILPVCLVSLAITAMGTPIPWKQALPYLPGSALGGFLAGLWAKKIPAKWLHRALGLLILWGGWRYLC